MMSTHDVRRPRTGAESATAPRRDEGEFSQATATGAPQGTEGGAAVTRPRFVGTFSMCPVLRARSSEIVRHFGVVSVGKRDPEDLARFWVVRAGGGFEGLPPAWLLDAPAWGYPVSVRLLRLAREAVSKGRAA